MNNDWINEDAKPNGIGAVCRYCDRLIDWHPVDHGPECPEYRDWCSCGPRCGIPIGVHEACATCGGLVTWEDFPFASAQIPPPLCVSWDDTVDPPTPLVTTVEVTEDGTPAIRRHNRDASLRMMWTEIERLRGSAR